MEPGLERELELERRKNREHHEQLREKDKEYAKIKVSFAWMFTTQWPTYLIKGTV